MVSKVEGLGTGTGAVTLVSFQGQAAVLMKDCVCPGGGAQDTGSGLSAMRTLTLELWPLEGLSMVAPLMTVCQAGAVRGSAVLECPKASCPPRGASHAQDLSSSTKAPHLAGHPHRPPVFLPQTTDSSEKDSSLRMEMLSHDIQSSL